MTTYLSSEDPAPPLPVRRLHNYIYCPRLFYFQWVENIFIENEDTVIGSAIHSRVDVPTKVDWDELSDWKGKVRSLTLESIALNIVGSMDLVELSDSGARLIDYKKGRARHTDDGGVHPKENDVFQLAAYALLLKENGIEVTQASVYYAEEKRHVSVELTEEVFCQCRAYIQAAINLANTATCPPPLINESRCLSCSAYPVCLPSESNFWHGNSIETEGLRPPYPNSDAGEIIVVQNPKAYIRLKGGEINVTLEKEVISKHPIQQLSSVYIYGAVQISTQATIALLEHAIPIGYFSPAGRYIGSTFGLPASGVDARLGQARLFSQPTLRCEVAREIIKAKIHNQRVMLMRNGSLSDQDARQLAQLRDKAGAALTLDSLRGIEGAAASTYFANFASMIKLDDISFDFNGRNRRPPKDPVNSLLSLAYSTLSKELTGICHLVGLDPFLGFYHSARYGRPALALDLMEEFRPIIADSVVISLINRRELTVEDFVFSSKGVMLKDSGRRQFWRAWFRRLDTEITHPEFAYKMSYRRMMDVQTRQLWRFCRGECPKFHGFITR